MLHKIRTFMKIDFIQENAKQKNKTGLRLPSPQTVLSSGTVLSPVKLVTTTKL